MWSHALPPCEAIDNGISLININRRLILSLLKPTCSNRPSTQQDSKSHPRELPSRSSWNRYRRGTAPMTSFSCRQRTSSPRTPLHTCAARTPSVAAQQACCRLSSNQRGQPCPHELRNVFNETHILEERLPAIGVVPKQAVIVHDVIQHTFGHP